MLHSIVIKIQCVYIFPQFNTHSGHILPADIGLMVCLLCRWVNYIHLCVPQAIVIVVDSPQALLFMWAWSLFPAHQEDVVRVHKEKRGHGHSHGEKKEVEKRDIVELWTQVWSLVRIGKMGCLQQTRKVIDSILSSYSSYQWCYSGSRCVRLFMKQPSGLTVWLFHSIQRYMSSTNMSTCLDKYRHKAA